jgi:hypothetical protein
MSRANGTTAHTREMTREEAAQRLEALDDRVRELTSLVGQLQKRVEDLEAENDELRARLDRATDHADEKRTDLGRRVTAIEDEVGLSVADALRVGPDDELTPLGTLIRAGPQAVAANPSAQLDRAHTIAANYERWGERRSNPMYGGHVALATRQHGLKAHMEDARTESLSWKQVHRAIEKVATLGQDAVVVDTEYAPGGETWGKTLVFGAGDGR